MSWTRIVRTYGFRYLLAVTTALLVVGYFHDKELASKRCDAITALAKGVNDNTRSRIAQAETFKHSATVAKAFGLTTDELAKLTAAQNTADETEIRQINSAVEVACA